MKNFFSFTFTNKLFIALSIFLVLVTLGVIFCISYLLYNRTVNILTDNLRQRLLAISITQAANIDAKDVMELQTEEDWKKPEWARVVNKLHKAKYSNDDIVFMYIIRYKIAENGVFQDLEFVADADSIDPYVNMGTDTSKYIDSNRDGKVEPDGPDKLQWPGQSYSEAEIVPEIKIAYERPITMKEIYEDAFGPVLTGYAPIKDENGKTVAILCTDIKANDFLTITRQTLIPFIIFISILSFFIIFLILVIILIWYKNSSELYKVNNIISSQKKTLEELLKTKDEIMHIVNHQVNTPLSIIKSSVAMYRDGLWDEKKFLYTLTNEVTRLSNTVAEFLLARKVGAEKDGMFLTPVDLVTLIEKLIEEKSLLKKVRENNMKITFNKFADVVNVKIDVGKITEVISNLLDNAINYSQGDVVVNLEKNENGVLLSVKDSGIGIAPENIDKLFNRFVRLDNAKKVSQSGTGLGLYVCKQIVEAHGGKIWVESEGEGKGATFKILFA